MTLSYTPTPTPFSIYARLRSLVFSQPFCSSGAAAAAVVTIKTSRSRFAGKTFRRYFGSLMFTKGSIKTEIHRFCSEEFLPTRLAR